MYAELNFGQEVFNQDGKSFAVHSNIAYGTYETGGSVQYNSQGNSYQENKNEDGQYGSPWNSGRMSVREMFVDAKGFLGDSTIWVGKRFGQRKDIHIMDLFYVMNSGYGAGFDGLSAGAGKFSAQWTQGVNSSGPAAGLPGVDGTQESWNRLNKLDLRYAFPVGAGNLELIGIYGKPTKTDAQEAAGAFDEDSLFFTVEHSMSIMGGFNKVALQYGTNALTAGVIGNFGGLDNAQWFGKSNGYRLLDHGVVKLGGKVELGYALTYGETDIDTVDAGDSWRDYTRYNAVLRPVYKWDNFHSTILEVGYDVNDPNDAGLEKQDLSKVTLAQAISAGPSFWARPQMRAFVSYYDGDRAIDNAELMVGAQVEAWW